MIEYLKMYWYNIFKSVKLPRTYIKNERVHND